MPTTTSPVPADSARPSDRRPSDLAAAAVTAWQELAAKRPGEAEHERTLVLGVVAAGLDIIPAGWTLTTPPLLVAAGPRLRLVGR